MSGLSEDEYGNIVVTPRRKQQHTSQRDINLPQNASLQVLASQPIRNNSPRTTAPKEKCIVHDPQEFIEQPAPEFFSEIEALNEAVRRIKQTQELLAKNYTLYLAYLDSNMQTKKALYNNALKEYEEAQTKLTRRTNDSLFREDVSKFLSKLHTEINNTYVRHKTQIWLSEQTQMKHGIQINGSAQRFVIDQLLANTTSTKRTLSEKVSLAAEVFKAYMHNKFERDGVFLEAGLNNAIDSVLTNSGKQDHTPTLKAIRIQINKLKDGRFSTNTGREKLHALLDIIELHLKNELTDNTFNKTIKDILKEQSASMFNKIWNEIERATPIKATQQTVRYKLFQLLDQINEAAAEGKIAIFNKKDYQFLIHHINKLNVSKNQRNMYTDFIKSGSSLLVDNRTRTELNDYLDYILTAKDALSTRDPMSALMGLKKSLSESKEHDLHEEIKLAVENAIPSQEKVNRLKAIAEKHKENYNNTEESYNIASRGASSLKGKLFKQLKNQVQAACTGYEQQEGMTFYERNFTHSQAGLFGSTKRGISHAKQLARAITSAQDFDTACDLLTTYFEDRQKLLKDDQSSSKVRYRRKSFASYLIAELFKTNIGVFSLKLDAAAEETIQLSTSSKPQTPQRANSVHEVITPIQERAPIAKRLLNNHLNPESMQTSADNIDIVAIYADRNNREAVKNVALFQARTLPYALNKVSYSPNQTP